MTDRTFTIDHVGATSLSVSVFAGYFVEPAGVQFVPGVDLPLRPVVTLTVVVVIVGRTARFDSTALSAGSLETDAGRTDDAKWRFGFSLEGVLFRQSLDTTRSEPAQPDIVSTSRSQSRATGTISPRQRPGVNN